MLNQITQHPNNAPSSEAKTQQPHILLRFKAHSSDKMKELWDAGEITRMEIIEDINNAPKYYTHTATKEFIIHAHAMLTASKQKAAKPLAESAHAVAQFAADLISENVTPAQLDYAFEIWRKRPEQFMPNQGQVLEIIRNAGFSKPTMGVGERHVERLRALIDPSFKPRPQLAHTGIRTEPKPDEAPKLSAEERQAVVDRLDARTKKLARGMSPYANSVTNADKERRRNLLLASRADKLVVMPKDSSGPTFYAVVAFDQQGKPTPLGTHMKQKDAQAFVDEAQMETAQ